MSDLSDKRTMVEKRARKEPKRLEEIAVIKLFNMLSERFLPRVLRIDPNIDWIGDSDAIREEALAITNWIYDTLSSSVADNIQNLILKSINQFMSVAKRPHHPYLRSLHLLLLHPKCRNLSSTWFPSGMIGDVADMLKSLICLEHIKWRYPNVEDKFVKNLKCCTRLKSFVCPRYCNDIIIKVLSQNCPLVSQLDMNDSEHVTDESTHYIKQMKSLMKCSIIGTSITIEGTIRIIKGCPQLHMLDMSHDMYDILKSFENVNDPIKLPLRTVKFNGHSITPGHIRLLKKYCPFLNHVGIDNRYLCIQPHCQLVNVEQITIDSDFSFPPVDYPVFRFSTLNTWLIGDRINVVNMIDVAFSDKDLVELGNVCPNVTELYVLVFFTANGYVSSEHHPFQKLKMLKFIQQYIPENNFREGEATIFKILLSYSTMITHVDIEGLHHIDDDVVNTISKTNRMPDLQYWQIISTRCTSRTLFLLFVMCPMLKFIGQVSTWYISPREVQKIESYMRKRNFDFDMDTYRPDAILPSIMNQTRNLLLQTSMLY